VVISAPTVSAARSVVQRAGEIRQVEDLEISDLARAFGGLGGNRHPDEELGGALYRDEAVGRGAAEQDTLGQQVRELLGRKRRGRAIPLTRAVDERLSVRAGVECRRSSGWDAVADLSSPLSSTALARAWCLMETSCWLTMELRTAT